MKSPTMEDRSKVMMAEDLISEDTTPRSISLEFEDGTTLDLQAHTTFKQWQHNNLLHKLKQAGLLKRSSE